MPDIDLSVWSADNNIPFRTAKNWARLKKIPAKLRTEFTTVTVKRRVRKYMIPAETPAPDFVN